MRTPVCWLPALHGRFAAERLTSVRQCHEPSRGVAHGSKQWRHRSAARRWSAGRTASVAALRRRRRPYHAAMRVSIFQLDAFTTRRFTGNPAAVVGAGAVPR